MLESLTFRRKIGLLVVAAVAGVALIATLSVLQAKRQITEGRKGQLVSAVQSAHTIVAGFQALSAAGKMPEADAKKAAAEAVKLSRYGDKGADYFYIWTLDGTGVMHPIKTEWSGQPMVGKVKDGNGVDIIVALMDGMKNSKDGRAFVPTNFPRPGDTKPAPKLQYIVKVEGWNWMVGSGLYTDDVDVQVREAALYNMAIGVLALGVIGGLGWLTMRSVMAQIGGEPSVAVAAMNDVAQGDLTVELADAPKGSVLHALGTMVASLRQTVSQVRTSTDNISTASTEIATGNQDLSSRTEQTASNLQQAASSMEQLTGTVKQSADSARQANQLAASAAEVAARGGSVVSQVVSTMDEINASSKKIADIIGVIDGIAFQTNILALNAAVEAARAGEQGRGFAVVASEVRSLAGRSAEAAKEIKGLIGASVDKVEAGSRLVAEAGSTMTEIVGSVQRVSDIIGEITAASSEQSEGIGQINSAVTQLDQMTQQNAALVEESAAAAESLKDQAIRLAQVVSAFRLASGGEPSLAKPFVPAATRVPASAPAKAAAPKAPVSKPVTAPVAAKPVAPAPVAAKPAPAPAPVPAAAASHADNDDWETF